MLKKSNYSEIIWLVVAYILVLVVFFLSSCSPSVVEVEKPVVIEHTTTTIHTDIVRDTLRQCDSVYHFVQGDTVVIERWHHVERVECVAVTDTLHDTIPKFVTVTKTVEVERKDWRFWTKLVCAMMILFGFYALYFKCK